MSPSLWIALIVAAALLGVLYAVFTEPQSEEASVNELMKMMSEEPHDR